MAQGGASSGSQGTLQSVCDGGGTGLPAKKSTAERLRKVVPSAHLLTCLLSKFHWAKDISMASSKGPFFGLSALFFAPDRVGEPKWKTWKWLSAGSRNFFVPQPKFQDLSGPCVVASGSLRKAVNNRCCRDVLRTSVTRLQEQLPHLFSGPPGARHNAPTHAEASLAVRQPSGRRRNGLQRVTPNVLDR